MIHEAQARLGVEAKPSAPSQATWTPEMSALASLNDGIQNLTRVTVMANSGKGKAAPSFQPYPRPESALDRALIRKRWENHEKLADRMLGRDLAPEERKRRLAAQEAEERAAGPATPAVRR